MRYLIGLFLILMIVMPVAAQGDAETVRLSGAYTIEVPSGWFDGRPAGAGYYWKTDASTIRIRTYSPIAQQHWDAVGIDNLLEYLVVDAYEARSVDDDQIETLQFGEYEGIAYTYEEVNEGRQYMRAIYMYPMVNDFIAVGSVIPNESHDLNDGDVVDMKAALETITLQDTFIFYEETQLDIPEGWQITDDSNTGFALTSFRKEGVAFDLWLWPGYGAVAGFERPADLLAYMYDSNWGTIESFSPSRIETIRVAGFDGALYRFAAQQTVNDQGMYDQGVLAFALLGNHSAFTVHVMTDSPDEPIDAIYEVLDTMQPGNRLVCPLFADPGIRIREEPSTTSALVRETEDETLIAVRQTTGSDGFTWFDVGEGWIRSDVIFYENNTCENIPVRR
ncbi:MAG: hypothetical protein HY866_04580 [Chloroflexi bacterium]|nr:hypothetical protein [Chloroflexota bacterium]